MRDQLAKVQARRQQEHEEERNDHPAGAGDAEAHHPDEESGHARGQGSQLEPYPCAVALNPDFTFEFSAGVFPKFEDIQFICPKLDGESN